MDDAAGPGPDAYRERLWPGVWLWALLVPALAALAVAYGRALGMAAGWLVAGVGAVALVGTIWWSSPVIAVDRDHLRAGRAALPLTFTGRVIVLDPDAARAARGALGDPTAYLLLRPGVGPGAVVVEVTDAEDPHRTWLMATRHPDRLMSAILTERGRLGP